MKDCGIVATYNGNVNMNGDEVQRLNDQMEACVDLFS